MQVNIEYKDKTYEILIDDEDYNKIKDLNLTIKTEKCYRQFVIDSTTQKRLHRFILNSKSNQMCIHKNNDKFDFRKENLILLTQKELVELVKTGKIKQKFDELDRIYYEF